MKKPTFKATLITATLLASSFAWSCSNLAVTTNNKQDTVVARTLDFETGTGNTMGIGFQGEQSTSSLNMTPKLQNHALHWVNEYDYIGQTGMKSSRIFDGINSAGLYAGTLYLPGYTQYPIFNAQDPKPALGISDMVNYILATSNSVADAVKHMQQVQVIASANPIYPQQGTGDYAVFPVHIVVRDKTGHAAVFEFVKGHMKIYQHPGNVFTNSPTLAWQIKNADKYNYVFNGNTAQKVGSGKQVYQNGSGYLGIPGDWTPAGRFARATQLLHTAPTVYTSNQAKLIAEQAIQSIQVPLGVNPSATIWESMADLKNPTYYFMPIYNVAKGQAANTYKYTYDYDFHHPWKTYNLKKIVSSHVIPKGWVSADIHPNSEPLITHLDNEVNAATQKNIHVNSVLTS